MAIEAAEPLGVSVFPVLAYGISPYFRAYPGSVSLRVETYLSVVREIMDCLAGSGFRRILPVNGHGGKVPVQGVAGEWMANHPEVRLLLHNWWNAPRTWAKVMGIDPGGLTRLVDGELLLDPPGWDQARQPAKAHGRP